MGKICAVAAGVAMGLAVAGGMTASVSARAAGYTVSVLTLTSGQTTYTGATGAGLSAAGNEGGYVIAGDGSFQAATWTGPSQTLTDLHPVGADSSFIAGVSSSAQVGTVVNSLGAHPAVWTGTAASVTLLPEGIFSGGNANSVVTSAGVNTVVGVGLVGDVAGDTHAAIWKGSGVTYTLNDIHPLDPTIVSSFAHTTDGVSIVGSASNAANFQQAAVWKISAPTSTFALLPGGFDMSDAWGVSGDQIVGTGASGVGQHAILWTSGGTVVTDLQGAAFVGGSSIAYATNGINQVGSVTDVDGDVLPYVWTGTATSASELPLPFASVTAEALGIDAAGDIVGYAVDGGGVQHAVLWTPSAVPEPGTLSIGLLAGIAMLRRRRK